jgi:transcription elongation factor Elf1
MRLLSLQKNNTIEYLTSKEKEMDTVNKLVDIYNNWGDQSAQKNLGALTSADEMRWHPSLTNKQEKWLNKFIQVWDQAQDHESNKLGRK